MPMRAKRISIKDIARLTNTSVTTVSMALNGKGRISPEIVKKIIDTALANGYQPNNLAVGLRTGLSKVIGVVLESVGGPFFGEMAKVIESEADKAGYGVIYSSTHNDINKAKKVIKMFSNQFIDGYIIVPVMGMEAEVEQLIAAGKPVVLIDGYYPQTDIPHVTVNNYESVYQAVNGLARAGYKNIAFLGPDLDLPQLQDRKQGYIDSLCIAGVQAENLIHDIPFEKEKVNLVAAIIGFLTSHKPDAVFCSTNYVGSLVLEAIKALKLKIPADIAVISFDDNELFELYPPGINAIKQPTFDIARSAIDILLSKLRDPQIDIAKIKLQIPAEYVKRASVRG